MVDGSDVTWDAKEIAAMMSGRAAQLMAAESAPALAALTAASSPLAATSCPTSARETRGGIDGFAIRDVGHHSRLGGEG